MRTTTLPARRVRSLGGLVALPCVLALVVAGCSDQDGSEPDPEASASATATSTGEPTADPSADPTADPSAIAEPDGVVDLSDEAAGIVFANLPDVTGDEAAVLNAYQTYEAERWAVRRTSTVAESAIAATTPLAYEGLADIVEYQNAAQAHMAGTITFAPTIEMVEGDVAAMSGCGDESAGLAVFPDATVPVVETSPSGMATYRVQAELMREAGTWKVSGYTVIEEACTV